ncbi:heme exporter protein CcmD [Elioraea sp. Yellowstone]|jgi:heme exporter protein D|uniref:heme exporter protein CcmD n=1 Tax=Elioraea sp. Yellowstone TaxID=2592070 RepID=UPI001153C0ED|nr:heme exporter protein CcmD [Elioraea sp. Yellowstone]TQF78445.1 heme exporter protein CcmD [Elioraea sp. Yellowstone]
MSAFLDMGGYAAFVWPAYAVAVGALVALAAISLRQWRAARAEVARLEALGPRRRGGGSA